MFQQVTAMTLAAMSLLAEGGVVSKPIGSVSSRGAVRVSGTTLDIAEVRSWPIVAGDVIQTQAAPATILFDGGTRLTVDASSAVTLTVRDADKLIVTLGAGAITYNVSKHSSLSVQAGKQTMVLQAGASGTIALDENRASARDDKARSSTQRQNQRQSRPVLSPHTP
jgi:hypothetical protein